MRNDSKENDYLGWLRRNIIGRNYMFSTPFGKRPLVYSDYTASGRGLYFIENYIQEILKLYANTHTTDDITGKTMTQLLHNAEKNIKRSVNGGKLDKIIFTGSGATGAITRFQQILGIYWSPAAKKKIYSILNKNEESSEPSRNKYHKELLDYMDNNRTVVLVGPYEHHSNELQWRETNCEVVRIPLNENGYLDLQALEETVSDKRYNGKQKIGSFSAASNVTGIKTPVYEVARILHKYKAIACFDFAASAPYVEIDMNKDDESYFDAIFFSPHKFLGGPGSAGVLIFKENLYDKSLPPCVASGGTVNYVSHYTESYINDIEKREKPGTPGILQAIRASLVFQVKEKVRTQTINRIKEKYIESFFGEFKDNLGIIIYSPDNPEKTVGIISFNIKHKDRVFHHKFVTKLLNDLFGIQSRAGCSCADPYGHELLHINKAMSNKCITQVKKDYIGIKRGWVRINLHYSLTLEEFEYIKRAIKFTIDKAYLFLPEYNFDIHTGEWIYKHETDPENIFEFDIEKLTSHYISDLKQNFNDNLDFEIFLSDSEKLAENLQKKYNGCEFHKFNPELEELLSFYVPENNLIRD